MEKNILPLTFPLIYRKDSGEKKNKLCILLTYDAPILQLESCIRI